MPTFILTSKRDIERPQSGLHIDKGQEITVNINMMGITPNNLFNNSRCQEALVKQFQLNGIYAPITDIGIYNKGTWDIVMR